jgi:DMSO/TMAO reductase YedYZ molybdopterin-dependent catalytic subunit
MTAAAGAGVAAMWPRSVLGQETTQPTPAPGGRAQMARFPEKTDLILLTDRPPQLETPIRYFRKDLTPNDAFFVRWHLSAIPTSVDLATFRLDVAGHVDRPMSLSVAQLKKDFEPVWLVAVAQCSGNSRSLFQPRVTGGQWGHGAVGNAKWTGVRLRDLLARAGAKAGAVDVSFAGLDDPPMPDMPKFVKSLEFARANDGEVMVAYAMNDAPLPMLNGFPLRLVVPGWYATYWVKSLNRIEVLKEKFHGFWMDKAYRISTAPDAQETPQKLATETVPINRHSCRSLVVRPEQGEAVPAGKMYEIEGVAFDAGEGIAKVEVSIDGGRRWTEAKLDPELGQFSWRRWRFGWKPERRGLRRVMARATNRKGETQTTAQWNRSGYQRNVIEHVDVTVA